MISRATNTGVVARNKEVKPPLHLKAVDKCLTNPPLVRQDIQVPLKFCRKRASTANNNWQHYKNSQSYNSVQMFIWYRRDLTNERIPRAD